MRIFKNRLGTRFSYLSLAAIAFSVLTFPLPIQSANEEQDPTVTSKQIESLPQSTAPQGSVDRIALDQAMLDLASPWTVMCVAAHPDDEDGTSLIVMRHKTGAHTVSLFSTFGEGGQNAIGPELYEEMGAIRARETMAAAEIQGSEPHFLGLKDFGFSKTRDEAFRFWGHEEALRRMVLEIRKLRPDIIITNHSTTSNDHGQHQATALMVVEAFDAAADPNKFPEQLKDGVTTWQVRRLFVRVRGNQAPAADEQIVTIDPNERDSIRGVAFGEEALRALQQHATQGPWPKSFAEYASRFRAFTGQTGAAGQLPLIRYRLIRSAKDAEGLTPDAESFGAGLVIPRELQPRLVPWNPDDAWIPLNERDQVLPRLLVLAKAFHQKNSLRDISTMPMVAALNKKLDAAIAAAAGMTVTVAPEAKTLVPGTTANFDITVSNHGSEKMNLAAVDLQGMGTSSERPAPTSTVLPGQSVKIVRAFTVPDNASLTVPHDQHLYDGKTFGEKFTATVAVVTGGQTFQVPASVAVDVTPKIEITRVRPSLIVVTPQNETSQPSLTIQLSNHDNGNARTSVAVTVESAKGERIKSNETPATIGAEESREIEINLPKFQTALVRSTGSASLASAAGIPRGNPTANSSAKLILRTSDKSSNEVSIPLVYADAHVALNLRVGYIRGFDFSLPNALNALGVESKELSVDDVKTADLSNYTSVIVDNRVYESKPELITVNQKLLDYARAGGTLIVFYHKSDEWNPDPRRNRPQLAPYKLILGGERITDENAPITFLEPDHPLLNIPNKMGQDDFKFWIQERGLYYPRDWDAQFHALLQSNDPGENPLKGGLLVSDYGKGHYIYTSMVWYRELRGGIPGAYRMLANMISYGRTGKLAAD
jgi:LmbE family N-acetylglucosaminyl deacetylase